VVPTAAAADQVGVTAFDPADVGPVPRPLVAATVNV
jgi:hypothetical protein